MCYFQVGCLIAESGFHSYTLSLFPVAIVPAQSQVRSLTGGLCRVDMVGGLAEKCRWVGDVGLVVWLSWGFSVSVHLSDISEHFCTC